MASRSSNAFNDLPLKGLKILVLEDTNSGLDTSKKECIAKGKGTIVDGVRKALSDIPTNTNSVFESSKRQIIDRGKGRMVGGDLPEINQSKIERFPVQYQKLMTVYQLACDHYQNTNEGETCEFIFENARVRFNRGVQYKLTISANNVTKGYVETIEAVGLVTRGVKVELLSCSVREGSKILRDVEKDTNSGFFDTSKHLITKEDCIAKGKGRRVNRSNIEIYKTAFPVQYQYLMTIYQLACDRYQNTHAGNTHEFSFENAKLRGSQFKLTISATNVTKGYAEYIETIEAVGLVTLGVKVELLSCSVREPKILNN